MAYGYYRSETVQASQVTGTLTDFPALFSRTHNDFRTVGNGGHVQNANGYDLNLFGDSSGAPGSLLDTEAETYNAATGAVIQWARVPSIATSTVVWWQYGDNGITTSQDNAAGVWDANYLAVYHFPNGSSLTTNDSTGNANHITPIGASVAAAAGQIDGGVSLPGNSSNYLLGTNTASAKQMTGPVTLEAYVNPQDASGFYGLVGRTGGTGNVYPKPVDCYILPTTPTVALFQGDGANFDKWVSTSTITAGVFTHIQATITGSGSGGRAATFAFNGTSDTAISSLTATFTPTDSNDNFVVGSRNDLFTNFTGVMDEVRISKVVRSLAWAEANYHVQSAPTSFWGLGSEQTAGGGAPALRSSSSLPLMGVM